MSVTPVQPLPPGIEVATARPRILDVVVQYRESGLLPGSTRTELRLYPDFSSRSTQWVNDRKVGPGDTFVVAHRAVERGPVTRQKVAVDGWLLREHELGSLASAITSAVLGARELLPASEPVPGDPPAGAQNTVTFSYRLDTPGDERMQRTFRLRDVPESLRGALAGTRQIVDLYESRS